MKKSGNSKKLNKGMKRNRITSIVLVFILAAGMVAGNLLTYAQSDAQTNTELNCDFQVHSHNDSCYENGQLTCGLADFAVHEHDNNCYDNQGRLICKLPEIKEHAHSDNCYTEDRVLVCGNEETLSQHVHTDECFTETKELVCADENHQHDDSCYEVQRVLSCGQDEQQRGHVHTDECFKIEKRFTCGKKEIILHEHSDGCYDADGKLICGKLQVLRHQHEDSEVISVGEETLNLSEVNWTELTVDQLNDVLQKTTPDELNEYIGNLSDEEYSLIFDNLSDEKMEVLMTFLAGSVSLMATTPKYYVGYSKIKDTLDDIEFAYIDSAVGVRKFYLAPIDVYNNYLSDKSAKSQNALIANSQVAYCFNYYKDPPGAAFNSASDRAFYSEKENTSASLFYNATSSHRRITNASEMYSKILSVALNGYPNDISGFQKKYGLTDDEFRCITQYAIWYYTDSISIKFTTDGGYDYFYMYADDTETWLSTKNGKKVWYPYNNQNLKNAYKELLASSIDTATVNASHINLYKNVVSSYNNKYYQDLLTVGSETGDNHTAEQSNELVISKTVSGQGGETNRLFNFTVNIKDSGLRPVTGKYQVTSSAISGVSKPDITNLNFNSSGQATFQLKHGQSIQINGLPEGFYYTVTEAEYNQDGYKTTLTQSPSSNLQDYEGASGKVSVSFNNSKESSAQKELKAVITAKKTLDGKTPADGQFIFVLKDSSGKEIDRTTNDENGKITFTKYYEKPGIYKYTIEEVNDGQAGIVYDTTPKEVTVTITSQDVETYDEGIPYYGQSYLDDDTYNFYYYIDSEAGDKGIRMFCTYHGAIGPQYASYASPSTQTYRAIINPTLDEVINEGLVRENQYGDQLLTKLKKLFYYLKTKDADKFEDSDNKQKLVWYATGIDSEDSPSWNITNTTINGVRVKVGANGVTNANVVSKILNAIYDTVVLPENYNIVFFQPTGKQLNAGRTQPLATGYGANITYEANEVVFENTTKPEEPAIENLFTAQIVANKTLDGIAPAAGQFTFILKDDKGNEVARTSNDVNGKIVFSQTFNQPGTYTYTIEEVNDNQKGIKYDTTPKTVTVEVGSEEIREIISSDSFVGSSDSNENIYITVNNKKLDVYCIYATKPQHTGNFEKTVNPTTSEIAENIMNADESENKYAADLANNLRKLFYYFDTHSYTDKVSWLTLNKSQRQGLVWCVTGYSLKYTPEMIGVVDQILAQSNPPQDYMTVMFAGTQNEQQPVMAGYLGETETSYNGQVSSQPEFVNTTQNINLNIRKTVTGNSGDKEKPFEFEIVLTNGDGTPLSGTFSDVIFNAEGKGTIYLTDGQSKTIEGLPEGYSYTITETNAPDYTTKINGSDDSDQKIDGSNVTQAVTVEFENNKDIPLTGLSNHYIPFIVTTIIGLCGAAYMMYRKKRRTN